MTQQALHKEQQQKTRVHHTTQSTTQSKTHLLNPHKGLHANNVEDHTLRTRKVSSLCDEPRVQRHTPAHMAPRHHKESSPTLPLPGEFVQDRYLVKEALGHGRYGWVFKVEHALLGQDFAMKILSPRVASDPDWITRFREEARLTSQLGHDNIVFVTDFGHCAKFGSFFVMESLHGVTLEGLSKEVGILPLERAIDIVTGCAKALDAMHKVGVVHRDIKPSNIMITTRLDGMEQPKLLDFGIAQGVIEAVETGKIFGSPAYMSPEQTLTMRVDHRADQFSLTCVLYELLTGQRPWTIVDWDSATPRHRLKNRAPAPSTISEQSLSAHMDAVIMRALEIDPKRRWPDMKAFMYALHTAAQYSIKQPPLRGHSATTMSQKEGLDADSMVILVSSEDLLTTVDQAAHETPLVSLSFRTMERLRKEVEVLQIRGDLFVRSEFMMRLGTVVKLRLVYEPRACAITMKGEVVAQHRPRHTKDSSGVAIALDVASTQRLQKLMHWIEVEPNWQRVKTIERVRPMHEDDDLRAGEAFLLTRIDRITPIREVRSMFSGLPFNLDAVLTSLASKSLLRIDGDIWTPPATPSLVEWYDAASAFAATEVEFLQEESEEKLTVQNTITSDVLHNTNQGLFHEPSMTFYSSVDIEHVLQQVTFLQKEHDYERAIDVLRQALDDSPTVGVFYQQLAMLYAHAMQDFERAERAIKWALQLEPHNQDFVHTKEYLHTLSLCYG